DLIAINKFDKRGSLDALRDVRKQWKRNHARFELADEQTPIFGTIASQFNDPGMNQLYRAVMDKVAAKTGAPLTSSLTLTPGMSEKRWSSPPERTRYLAGSVGTCEAADRSVRGQAAVARKLYQLEGVITTLCGESSTVQERNA